MGTTQLSQRRERRGNRLFNAAMEALEPRQLLTVDLTGAFTTFPSTAVLAGSKQAVTLHLTNDGTTKATGSLAIDLYAQGENDPFNSETATYLGRVNTTAAVNASGSQDVNFQMLVSPALAAGNYHVFAVIDALSKIAETNEINNMAESGVLTVTQPDYDLTASFTSASVSNVFVSNDNVTGTAQIVIGNPSASSATVAVGVNVGVKVFARPDTASDDTFDVLINKSAMNVAVGGLAPGKTKNVGVPVTLTSLAAGSYNLVAKVDTADALAETNEDNNSAALAGTTLTVTPRTTDLAVALNSATVLPAGPLIFSGTQKLTLKLDVTVTGNRGNASTEKVNVLVLAHPHSGGDNIIVQNFPNVTLGAVQPGGTKTLTLNATLPFGETSGDYDFIAVLSTPIASDNPANNSVNTSSLLSPVTINRGFYDLQSTISSSTLATAIVAGSSNNKGQVKVDVTNVGNVALPAVQRVNVTVALRPTDASDDAQDLTIGALTNQSVAKLAPNGKKTFTVNATVGAAIASDAYTLVTKVTPVESLTEELLTNNSASAATITVSPAFVNLDIVTATTNLAGTVVGGTTGNGTVTITNNGNVPAVGSVNVQFFATTTGDIDDGVLIGQKSFTLNLTNGKTSGSLVVPVAIPTNADPKAYTIIAKIVPTGFTDTDADDNTQNVASIVNATPATVDIHIASASIPFLGSATGGATGDATFTLDNLGTVKATGDITVTYYASTDSSVNAGATNATSVGSITLHNLSLNAGASSTLQHVTLTLPNPDATTNLKIFARVTVGAGITDNNTANNDTVSLGTITTSHFTTPFPLTHGNKLKFTATQTNGGLGQFQQLGTFTTEVPGVTGTYLMTISQGSGVVDGIALTFNNLNPPGYNVGLTFNGTEFLFGGKTITFSFDSANNKGTANVSGQTVFFSSSSN